MDEPPYHLDIEDVEDSGEVAHGRKGLRGRPWVGIRFDCCGAYARIYRNVEGTAYQGACPHCRRQVTLKVGPGGTDSRFFSAT